MCSTSSMASRSLVIDDPRLKKFDSLDGGRMGMAYLERTLILHYTRPRSRGRRLVLQRQSSRPASGGSPSRHLWCGRRCHRQLGRHLMRSYGHRPASRTSMRKKADPVSPANVFFPLLGELSAPGLVRYTRHRSSQDAEMAHHTDLDREGEGARSAQLCTPDAFCHTWLVGGGTLELPPDEVHELSRCLDVLRRVRGTGS
ncbi:hypothetical protein C2E23DRAFT_457855 [Lenzites betulinus]|nr:hypothetical protein C2E23DRAFT_457855 [Lenzites betulinus]